MPLISVWECPECKVMVKKKTSYIKHLKSHARVRIEKRKVMKSLIDPQEKFISLIRGMSINSFVNWAIKNKETIEDYGEGLDNISSGRLFCDGAPIKRLEHEREIRYTEGVSFHSLSMAWKNSPKNSRTKKNKSDHRYIHQDNYTIRIGSSQMKNLWSIQVPLETDDKTIATMKLLAD